MNSCGGVGSQPQPHSVPHPPPGAEQVVGPATPPAEHPQLECLQQRMTSPSQGGESQLSIMKGWQPGMQLGHSSGGGVGTLRSVTVEGKTHTSLGSVSVSVILPMQFCE